MSIPSIGGQRMRRKQVCTLVLSSQGWARFSLDDRDKDLDPGLHLL